MLLVCSIMEIVREFMYVSEPVLLSYTLDKPSVLYIPTLSGVVVSVRSIKALGPGYKISSG